MPVRRAPLFDTPPQGLARDWRPNRHASGRAVGLPSDDSQLAFRTVEHLLEHGRLAPGGLAARFASEPIFGIGQAVSGFVHQLNAGAEWVEAAPVSAGNGALMRIAPILLPYLRGPSAALWVDAALCARLTHADTSSVGASVAFVALLWQVLSAERVPAAPWWAATFVPVLRQLETDTVYRPRGGRFVGWEGTLSAFLDHVLPDAVGRDLTDTVAAV